MKERPIIFSAPMVNAILDGRKTQTRRIVKPQPKNITVVAHGTWIGGILSFVGLGDLYKCPYGDAGDEIWVRENWQVWKEFDKVRPRDLSNQCDVQYPATYDGWDSRVRPSIHMPRWASRIQLRITNIRVERLSDISEEDSKSEGCQFHDGGSIGHSGWRMDFTDVYASAGLGFFGLWQRINGEKSLHQNPWVWVIEFERIKP